MTTSKPKTSLTIALDFLHDQLERGLWKKGQRLPEHKKLAAMAHVGHTAMCKALSIARNEKKIALKRKSGIYAGDSIPEPEHAGATSIKWLHLKERIKKELLTGQLGPSGITPSSKELAGRYSVDYRTLKKALESLYHDDRLLEPFKHRYRLKMSRAGNSHKIIYLIMSKSIFELTTYPSNQQIIIEFTRELEKECTLKHIKLIKIPWSDTLSKKTIENPFGFIVWYSPDFNPIQQQLVATLRHFGKPIAIFPIDQSERENTALIIKSLLNQPDVFINETSSIVRAGIEMGRWLYAHGHKKVCFIAHIHSAHANDYLEGITTSFNDCTVHDGVVPLFYTDQNEAELQLLTTDKDDQFEKSIQPQIDYIVSSQKSRQEIVLGTAGVRLGFELEETRFAINIRSFFTPLFRKALTVPNVTVWVCYDDFLACHGAMEFLHAEGMDIPGQLGVVGCNNFNLASMRNLTTYHFDYPGVVRKMLGLIMYPEHSQRSFCIKGTNMFEVDGMVIDRGSA